MHPFGPIAAPDPRLAARLVGALRQAPAPATFIAGGQALSVAALLHSAEGRTPSWAGNITAAMTGALILVQYRAEALEDDDVLVALASAAAQLAVTRPALWGPVQSALHDWLGRLGPVQPDTPASVLAARVLLLLLIDDGEGAAETVDRLVDRAEPHVGWLLHDWVVARLQNHGPGREVAAWHNLRVALAHAGPHRDSAMLLVLGALVAAHRAGHGPTVVGTWLAEVAAEVRSEGTSSRTLSA